MKKIIIATRNKGKIKEFDSLLDGIGIEILSLDDFPDMPDVEEDGSTFIENALKKARETAVFTGIPALADDSGLVVDALDGQPGVKSARFAPTNDERIARLLDLMEKVPEEKRTARFVCALALAKPDTTSWSTECSCEGVITRDQAGKGGFGYDPIFMYEPLGKTFAEIPAEIKNGISHRGKAMAEFRKAIENGEIIKQFYKTD